MSDRKPLIGIMCDYGMVGPHPFHRAGDKYIRAVLDVMSAVPVLIPAVGSDVGAADVLDRIDGVLIPGGYSNIERQRYGLSPAPEDELQDPARDATTLGLIPALIDDGIPLFAICRGMQEVNVALGGTLHPRLHEVRGRFDHRENKAEPLDVQYGPAHPVTPVPEGFLARHLGTAPFMINSLHGQGIDTLATRLRIDAVAEDDTIEAVVCPDAPGFFLGVQWHPEWRASENAQSVRLFNAFKAAACAFAAGR